ITSTALKDTTVSLVANHNYTAWFWGNGRSAGPDKMHLSFLEETVAEPGTQVALRVANATANATDVREYTAGRTAPAAATWASVPAFSVSSYVLVAPGTIMYNVQPAGGGVALFADAQAMVGT